MKPWRAFLEELTAHRRGDLHLGVHADSGLVYELSRDLYESLSPRDLGPLPVIDPPRTVVNASPELERVLDEDWAFLERAGYARPRGATGHVFGTIVLNLAHGCNFSCSYCCVGPEGLYGGPASRMSAATIEKAVEFLAARSPKKHLELFFFGGEPFLNWEGIVHGVRVSSERFPDRAWSYGVVTNGSLITRDRAAFLAKHRVRCHITLSGPPELHDRHRQSLGGGGTYDRVLEGVKLLREAGAPYTLKSVITEDMNTRDGFTLEQARKFLEPLAAATEPVQAVFEHGYYFRTRFSPGGPDDQRARDNLESTRALLEGRSEALSTTWLDPMDIVLMAGNRPAPVCSAGTGGLQVLPDGGLHVCHISAAMGAGGDRYRLGDLEQGADEEALSAVRQRFGMPSQCRTCWARSLCTRECHLLTDRLGRIDPSFCRGSQEGILQGAELAARLPWSMIHRFYSVRSEPAGMERLQRAYETRELLRRLCAHVKPLFLFPTPSETPPTERIVAGTAAAGIRPAVSKGTPVNLSAALQRALGATSS